MTGLKPIGEAVERVVRRVRAGQASDDQMRPLVTALVICVVVVAIVVVVTRL